MRLIRLKEMLDNTGLSRAYMYKLMAEGKFPKSVSLGFRSVAWVESEVQDWILERVAERDERLGLPMLEQEAVA
ncbi:helix-turn-helix transcriptional regulator [Vibrio alginolyticus]|uniref:helix-turn-helix transcriptional regulator n=1 Tax=Vibrio alginolyticus TaxID=663 RepID=UPI001BD492C1|nr:AlpA family transcriptional regulator [Vibrio alginolyticus]MBS9852715.1 AlpA family transcriptional regulator [Vibrio alginolyticus]